MNDMDITEKPEALAGEEGTDAEEVPDIYCAACKQNLKDTSDNPESLFCTSCREQLIHYPFPKWLLGVMVAVAALCVVAFWRVPSLVRDYDAYKAAEAAYEGSRYNTAANAYLALSDKYQNGKRIHERLFLSLCKAQRLDEAGVVFETYLAGKDGNGETYEEINDYATWLTGYYNTLYEVYQISESTDREDVPAMYAKVDALKSNEECDAAAVRVYLGQFTDDREQTLQLYREALELEPRYTMIEAQIGNILRRLGRMDEAKAAYEQALKARPEDQDAYKGLGVLYLMEGNVEQGLTYAKQAYEWNPSGQYMAESYAVALYEIGRKDEALALYESLKKDENYQTDDEYEAYFQGKATLKDLYIGAV